MSASGWYLPQLGSRGGTSFLPSACGPHPTSLRRAPNTSLAAAEDASAFGRKRNSLCAKPLKHILGLNRGKVFKYAGMLFK